MLAGVASSLPREEILKTQVYRVEKTVELMKKETERQGKRVSQVVQILDMDGFGRKHMWIPGKTWMTLAVFSNVFGTFPNYDWLLNWHLLDGDLVYQVLNSFPTCYRLLTATTRKCSTRPT